MAESIIQQKSFVFSLKILALTDKLQKQRQYALADQLFRGGTGIGSNVEEASAGVSRDDFRAKLGIAAKEARETRYWLRLMMESGLYHIDVTGDLNDAEELVRILTAIVKTLDGQRERERKQKTQNAPYTPHSSDTVREAEMDYASDLQFDGNQLRALEEQIEREERKRERPKTTQNSKLKT